MGFVKSDRVTTEFVLSRVDEAQVFSAYHGPFRLNRTYSSYFRRDENPSCSFFVGKSGKIMYHDFSTGESMDCFNFVARAENCSYREAVQKVACDFGLIDCGPKRVFTKQIIKKAEVASDKIKKETKIEIVPASWDSYNWEMWSRLSIMPDELDREEIYAVDKLYINDKLIPNYRNELRYCYVVNVHGVRYKKIYTPYAKDKRFKWISNVPLHIPFGINKLKFHSKTLIISKSQKERLLWMKFFPDVIAAQNENPASIKEKTIKFINKHYDRVYTAFDCDEAGTRNTEYFMSNHNYIPINLPVKAIKKHGIKDWAELVEVYGLDKMEKYLKHIKLI